MTTFGPPSSSMCSIKDAAEKLEQDRKKARQELLLMTQKMEEYEKTEVTMGKNLESEREMTSKLRASLNSANRRIGELSEKFKAVEGAHEEIRDRLARAEKAEKTCDENLTFAQDALTDRLECDEKYLKALKTSIKERDGLFAANEELVKRARVVRESREERGEGEGNSRGEGRRVGAFTEESGTREGLIAPRNGLGEESDGSERQL